MLLFSGSQIASCSIERHIGETVVDAVCAISRAVTEYHEGGLRAETKVTFGDLIGRLYDLWRYTAGHMSFDDVARYYGKIVLRERFGSDVSEAALVDELLSFALDTLAQVVKKLLN
jgi:hypothetical protein